MTTAVESITPARMKTDEAAQFLGIKPQTLVNWRCNGRGPEYIRMGKVVRYDRGALLTFCESMTVRPATT